MRARVRADRMEVEHHRCRLEARAAVLADPLRRLLAHECGSAGIGGVDGVAGERDSLDPPLVYELRRRHVRAAG